MYGDYQIIDADCHVSEPLDLWRQRLEPAFLDHALSDDFEIDGETIFHKLAMDVRRRMPRAAMRDYVNYGITRYDAESYVKAITTLGADMAFLYPTLGIWLFAIDAMDGATAGAYIRAYNDWLLDFCSRDPDLLRGVGVVNRHEPAEMIPELQRIAAFGWKAAVLRPNVIKGRGLSHPDYEPFWSECERLGIAVGIHEGTHARIPAAGADRFATHYGMFVCSHPVEQMMALLELIEGGVLERHPRLRVAFLESGSGWLPHWLWRMDRVYEETGWEIEQHVKMPPSDYFRRQCFIAVEPSEPYLPALIDFLGTDRVLMGSDFPHHDHDPKVIKDAVALEGRLPRTAVRKLLWDNPARFYGL